MPPCDLLAITAWEQRYSTQLPEVRANKETFLIKIIKYIYRVYSFIKIGIVSLIKILIHAKQFKLSFRTSVISTWPAMVSV